MFRILVCVLAFLAWTSATLVGAADSQPKSVGYKTATDIHYRTSVVATINEQCRLDVYYPENVNDAPTIVWFHGGGLTGGKREIPSPLKNKGVIIVGVDYRLSPQVTVNDCIDDAAASVAWTFNNIEQYGGSRDKIFVSGHSAGGYLTSMIGMDKTWLAAHQIDADDIAGLIPFSGHTITHFTARKEQGIGGKQPVIDRLAPLFHVRNDCPPLLLITGDRELEMLGRYEENAYLWRMMQVVGHPNTKLHELDGFNHGQMAEPAFPLLLRFVHSIAKD
ncbi:alpha/beta hydrolase [Novipirellula caenicola]|uniref:Acetyl esterase n=1 Tax=Novipirellula caenicola TaxID=1536901 RepID=A0ABP9VI06_9BACT